MIRARIAGVGLLGPGLPNWRDGCSVLTGAAPYEATAVEPPRPQQLSARERRRTSYGVRLGMAVAQEAVDNAQVDPATLPTVFGWAHGDGPVMQHLLETLATPQRFVSPTEFHNSVHNVAVGYWTIASGSHEPSSSIAAGIDTFAAALLKAMTEVTCEERAVLLVVCGIPFPEPLNTVCPVGGPFGAAFVLSPAGSDGGIADLTLDFDADAAGEPARPDGAPLRDLWALNAAARSLPLLEAVAANRPADLLVPYGPDGGLRLTVSPC